MNFNPFVDLVNKVRSHFFDSGNPRPVATRPNVVRAEKAAGARLSKTVMPNSTRTIAPQDPFQAASGNAAPNVLTAAKPSSRMVSMGATQSSLRPQDLPPAIALALEPKVERAISLQLSEILGQVPFGYIKSEESFDPTRRVLLKAVELEKGMAERNPNVALTSIYEQIPEIFMRSVPITDNTRIALPFDKVFEQFNRVQVRRDQIRDNLVPQVDTPFLLVAQEESEKFGTTIEPIQASALPPLTIEPATAEAFANAEPEAAASEPVAPPSSPRSTVPLSESRVSEEPPHHFAPPPARIPFHLPPKGTGAPASERVPASSGPPVLPPSTSEPPIRKRPPASKPPGPSPLKNPYESVPFDQLQFAPLEPGLKSQPVPETPRPRRGRKPVEAADLEPIAAPPLPVVEQQKEDVNVALSLRVVLQNLPAFQRQGDPNLAPEEAKVGLPLSLITEQLATGRVAISSKVFQEAIPADYRHLFQGEGAETTVLLPLQEVMKNVPVTALQVRSDQEQLVTGEAIETPFSRQAEADARRFHADTLAPVEPLLETPATIDEPPVEKVDARQMVARVTALPGVDGCSITFSDGLSLAGNLPAAMGTDGLCAVAPTLLQRIDKHMLDTKLGSLDSMTLHGINAAVTFFMQGNICLSALHANGELTAETRTQLSQMVNELSRTYSQPEITNVDH
jgi:predicted regulator of Ras-like GTPase activity (Roadblock/LC7/MglB family)